MPETMLGRRKKMQTPAPERALVASGLRPASDDALIGHALGGRIMITERLGSGTFGVVYRAEHLHLARSVAVKVLHASLQRDPSVRARFHAEGRAATLLDHPNLVRVLDFGEEHDGTLWLATELLYGVELSRVLKSARRLRVERATALMLQITAGLAHAHEHGILHGGLKPSNVMIVRRLDDDGREREHATLCDFGVVRGIAEGTRMMMLGAPTYMSPEQCLGERLDARSDVYGCGAMFYELITGEPPFVASDLQMLLRQHLLAAPVRPSQRCLDIDPRVDSVTMKALAKEPANRFSSMRDFRQGLREMRSELGARVVPSVRPPAAKTVIAMPAAAFVCDTRAEEELPIEPADVREVSGAYLVSTDEPSDVISTLTTDARLATDTSELKGTHAPMPSEIRALRPAPLPRVSTPPSAPRRSFTPSPSSSRTFAPSPAVQLNTEAAAAVAQFLAARESVVDPEKRALAALVERGDVDEIAARVTRLMSRCDPSSARALTILDDPKQLAPLAEALLADFILPTPYIERMLARAGLAAARALWSARIRRPATEARRMRFVSWLRVIGRAADELLCSSLAQLALHTPSPGQIACVEDLLLTLPRPLDARLTSAVRPFRSSPDTRIRELASSATARVD